MMKRLLEALASGEDIGQYGRLVFAMVARHFISREELVEQLCKCPAFSQEQALSLVDQVSQRDYNPPRREKILAWQQEQDYQICPVPGDPDACNLYKNLKFPGWRLRQDRGLPPGAGKLRRAGGRRAKKFIKSCSPGSGRVSYQSGCKDGSKEFQKLIGCGRQGGNPRRPFFCRKKARPLF
ncbi:MAG TPA: hypothetical protein VE783_01340 [Candidatus Limnocylindrales bacterium]|jgi:hypothetical protein|nr:hypothetical protein [Candidatus Limnocylindrales bacterium]